MKFFDFRLRPPTRGFLNMILFANHERRDIRTRMHGFKPAPSASHLSLDLLFEEMDAGDVAMGLVVGRESTLFGSITNEDVQAIVNDYPDRFVGAASVEPVDRHEALDKISSAVEAGFKAINLEPASYATPMKADDARMYPIYAHCETIDIPVIIMAGGSAGDDLSFTVPTHLDRMAADFPELKIIVSHGGWPWVHQMLHIAYRRPNVYLSADQYLARMPGHREYVEAADGFLADRFLYGSSYPYTPVKDYADWYRELPISAKNMRKTGYENAARLLGLDLGIFE
jgi:predicted TIM-barrel fold metal-dependent hydrolase